MRVLRALYAFLFVVVFVVVGASPATAAFGVDCKEAPTAEAPGGGFAGFFATGTDNPAGKAWVNGAPVYEQYGMAGLTFQNYDLGCGPDISRDPTAIIGTAVANWMMEIPKFAVAATTAFLSAAYNPTYLQTFDPLITNATRALRTAIYDQWAPLAVVVVGVLLLWGARRMKVSQAVTAAGWAVLVMILASAVFSYPVKAGSIADGSVGQALGAVNAGINGQASADPANGAGSSLSNAVLFEEWKIGTFGRSDSPTVRKYVKDIYTGQALTYAEAKTVRDDPDGAGKDLIEHKKEQWTKAAEAIKNGDPDAYEYLTGKRGARVGAALLSYWAMICTIPFLAVAALLLIGSYLVIRLAVVFFPVIATVGIVYQARGAVVGIGTVVMAAVLNSLMFGIGASVTVMAVRLLLSPESGLPLWLALVLMGLFSLVMWIALKPMRKLTSMASPKHVFADAAGGISATSKKAAKTTAVFAKDAAAAYIGAYGAIDMSHADLGPDGKKKDEERPAPSETFTNTPPTPTPSPGPAPLPLEAAQDRSGLNQAPTSPDPAPLPPGAPQEKPHKPLSAVPAPAEVDTPPVPGAGATTPPAATELPALPPAATPVSTEAENPIYVPGGDAPNTEPEPLVAAAEPQVDEVTGEEVFDLFVPGRPDRYVSPQGESVTRDDGAVVGAWRKESGDGWVGRDESFTDYDSWRRAADAYRPPEPE